MKIPSIPKQEVAGSPPHSRRAKGVADPPLKAAENPVARSPRTLGLANKFETSFQTPKVRGSPSHWMFLIMCVQSLFISSCAETPEELMVELDKQTKSLEEELKNAPNEPLPEAFFPYITDGDNHIEDLIYTHLMNCVASTEFSGKSAVMDYSQICSEPAKYRAKSYRVFGTVVKTEVDKIPERTVFIAMLLTPDKKPVLVHFPTKPDIFYVGDDMIETEGVFVKTCSMKRGNETIPVPFFAGKFLRKYY